MSREAPPPRASKKKKGRASSPSSSASKTEAPRRDSASSDRRLYGGIAALVILLGSLVWWSLPGDRPAGFVADSADGDTADAMLDPRAQASNATSIDRPSRASAEFAVITDRPDDVVRALATVTEIGKRLDVRHCGGACSAVKKFMADEDGFELDVVQTDDLILPPKDTLDTVAAGLSPSERESVHGRKTAVTIRAQGSSLGPEQLPARAAFAAAGALAEAVDGFVYDEVSRRIETAHEFVSHSVVAPLGTPAFAPRHIVVQFYRQEDGSARLLTLGMARFGSPDISIRGANMSSGPLLSGVINAVASSLARGKSDRPVTVKLEDIAHVLGKKPSELGASSEAHGDREVNLDVAEPERIEGDPDNEMIELVPKGGASRENWDVVVTNLFGAPPSVGTAVDDRELANVATKARSELPSVIKRFEAGGGELFIKGPFPIPPESRVDGGASTELLWISVASCDAKLCLGILSNEPSYATNFAAGKTTSVARAETVDWLLQQRDGGTAGGESIKVLKRRAKK